MASRRQSGNRDVLFIGPDRADLEAIEHACRREDGHRRIVAHWAKDLGSALLALEEDDFDAILLDMFLPESKGLLTLEAVQAAATRAPIMVIARPEDEPTARSAVKCGARDYAIKGRLDIRPFSSTLQNLIDRKATDDALNAEKERAEVTLNSIGDAVLSTGIDGRVTYLNVIAEKMTGWSREDALGRAATEVLRIIDGITREPVPDPLQLAIRLDRTTGLTANSILIRRDGFESAIEDSVAPIHDRAGKVTGAVVVFHDVSEARAMALRMSHLAQHDFLTDLPNRVLFNDRLTQAIGMARRHQRQLGVLFLDCDSFKEVNDSFGHDTGDVLLQSVAKRLVSVVRSSDTVCRQGGDEFVILLAELEKAEDADICAKKIVNALATPHRIGQHDLSVTASIGSAIYPDDGRNVETLIRSADMALYAAKEGGRNRYRAFHSKMRAREAERESVEGSLLQALERNQFHLYYQPRVILATGAVVGVEALIRWDHPERGPIPPAEFVPIAEDSGSIVPIGRWVLREACQQAVNWQKAGLGIVPVAVNVSAVEFRSAGFLEGLTSLLAETGLNAEALELELTERVLMQDTEAISGSVRTLTALGVRLTLDDFGTGLSNLSYLKLFPISTLKIDASFVKDLSTKESDRTLVAAIIGLGKTLGQTVIAEGIETEDQLDVLRRLGCDQGQGFHLCRPLPPDDFATYFAAAQGLRNPALDAVLGMPERATAGAA
jgi:diguanylate cyclase (GGDEF)-like protein/PAS domain S-box-containing protein